MNLEEAKKLLKKETSEKEIYRLRIEHGKSPQEIIDTIDEAIDLVCDMATKYKEERLE